MLSKLCKAFFSKVVAGVGVLSLNFFLGHYYGVTGAGQFMFMLSVVVGISVFVRIGLDNLLLRELSISYDLKEDQQLIEAILNSFLWCFSISSVFVLFFLVIFKFFFAVDIVFSFPILLTLPFYGAIYLQSSMLKAVDHTAIAPFFETGSVALLLSVFIVIVQYIGYPQINVVAWGFLFSSIVIFISGDFILAKRLLSRDGKKLRLDSKNIVQLPWRKHKGLGSFFILSANAYLSQWGIVLLLGLLMTDAEVGAFTIAHRLALVISFVLIVINGVASPKFSSLYNSGRHAEMQRLVTQLFWLGLGVSLIAFFFVVYVGVNLIGVFIPDAQHIGMLLLILGAAQVVNVITGPSMYLLMMTNNEKWLKNYMLLYTAISLVVLFLIAYRYGLVETSIAFALLEAAKYIFLIYVVKSRLGIVIIPGLGGREC